MPNFVFHSLRVRSFSLDHLMMSWEVDNSTTDPWDFNWYVERSESPMGPFDPLAGPFSDRYRFVDHEVSLLHRWRKLYYRIKSVRKADVTDIAYSAVAALEAAPDLVACEVRRLEEMAFRTKIGRMCWLFPVRTFGTYCPNCFDKVLGKRVKDNCLICYQVGFVGGYMHPIECWVQVDPSSQGVQRMSIAETQQSNTTARLSAFPPVRPDDILVEAENKRWRVAVVSNTERMRAVVQQQLTLHEITPGDVEFQLPVKVDDPLTLEPSDRRNFTNPQNLEAFERAAIKGLVG